MFSEKVVPARVHLVYRQSPFLIAVIVGLIVIVVHPGVVHPSVLVGWHMLDSAAQPGGPAESAYGGAAATPPASVSPFPQAPLPLNVYPRPPHDNGLGVHWSTHLGAQSDETTSYFVSELTRMNIRWVKLLNDGTRGRDYDRTIDELVRNGMMPVLRIYQRCNTAYDMNELERLVRHYVSKGIYYFETYNEPNLPGESGGWCEGGGTPQPEYLARIWAPAARVIYLAGGYPSLPSFFAPSQKLPGWQQDFFYRFFRALRAQGDESVLYFSWAPIHNYAINHPPTYPYDEVNLTSRLLTQAEILRYQLTEEQVTHINMARVTAHQPGGFFLGDNAYDDTTGFLHFISYRNQFYDLFGFDIPLISTEGGATRGSSEDPRYPPVDSQTVAEWTLWAADYMLDDAPEYYFATMTWLLAQRALDYPDPTWEINAWYHDRQRNQEPVVDALKERPRRQEERRICSAHDLNCWQKRVPPQPESNRLAQYARPAGDNGRGVLWSADGRPPSLDEVDNLIPELLAMNIKWVIVTQDDQPQLGSPHLIRQLSLNGIEPVLRVRQTLGERYVYLQQLLSQATDSGIRYFELFPEIAGDRISSSSERLIDSWLLAARAVHKAGGRPSLPQLSEAVSAHRTDDLVRFVDGVRARGQKELLPGTWLALHLFPGSDSALDRYGLRQVEASQQIIFARLGYCLPMMAIWDVGENTGGRSPLDGEEQSRLALGAFHALLDRAPAYLFAQVPGMLLDRAAKEINDGRNSAAWYSQLGGLPSPVVEVLKTDPRRYEVRTWQESCLPDN